MNDTELERYSRQILLPQIDYAGQQRLRFGRVAIIGVGGLGCPAALALHGSGVGTLTLVDHDRVDASNLPRQTLFDSDDIGAFKTDAAVRRLQRRDPISVVHAQTTRATPEVLRTLAEDHDLLIDATDRFEVRDAINAAGFATRTPVISGAALGWHGQIATFDFRTEPDNAAGCYRCLYADAPDDAPRCADAGVINTVTQIIGTLQAHEALRILLGLRPLYGDRLGLLDLLEGGLREIVRRRDIKCPVCGTATKS